MDAETSGTDFTSKLQIPLFKIFDCGPGQGFTYTRIMEALKAKSEAGFELSVKN